MNLSFFLQFYFQKNAKTPYKYWGFVLGSNLGVNWEKDESKMELHWEYDLCYNGIVEN